MTNPLQSIWRHEARFRKHLPERFSVRQTCYDDLCVECWEPRLSRMVEVPNDAALIILCYAAERALYRHGFAYDEDRKWWGVLPRDALLPTHEGHASDRPSALAAALDATATELVDARTSPKEQP